MAKVEESSKLATDLSEKFEALFPTWPTMVATLLSLIITTIVLTKFLYKPIKKMHNDRKKYIQDNIDSSEKQNKNALLNREESNEELISARIHAKEIILKAKKEALEIRDNKIKIAKLEANKVIEDARKQIESEKTKFKEDSTKIIIDIAITAASKIVEKETDNKTNRKIIEDFIKVKK